MGGMVLLRVGELAQHVPEIVGNYQMMAMGAADDAEHLNAARRSVGMGHSLPSRQPSPLINGMPHPDPYYAPK